MAKKKILVVDDDLYIIKVIKSKLEANNYEVFTAGDGEECVKKVLSEKPDLIILDIMMPKMDGYNTLITMRQMIEGTEEKARIPVIILTARAESEIKNLFDREEIEDYIVKPFSPGDLLGKIEEILGKKP
ncbi:MAG: response regulator [bacterium]